MNFSEKFGKHLECTAVSVWGKTRIQTNLSLAARTDRHRSSNA